MPILDDFKPRMASSVKPKRKLRRVEKDGYNTEADTETDSRVYHNADVEKAPSKVKKSKEKTEEDLPLFKLEKGKFNKGTKEKEEDVKNTKPAKRGRRYNKAYMDEFMGENIPVPETPKRR